jgi:nucleotide-binding universal stress UspA family protein
MYERIVAGTDLSDTARRATDRAAWLAQKLGAELVLVHAGTDPGDALATLGDEYGAKVDVKPGHAAEVLISEAERLDAGLLVVGSVGMSGARRFMLGNVPNKVSHHATQDLLVVKTDSQQARSGGYRRILAGTDGSDTATLAVDAACELAAGLRVALTIVCVYEPPSQAELDALRADSSDAIAQWNLPADVRDTPSEFRWRVAGATQAEDVLDRAMNRADKHGIEVETRAVKGPPAETLLDIAASDDFDLIVVGSVGMTGAKRFALGNVPHRISHHAPIDVLICRTK